MENEKHKYGRFYSFFIFIMIALYMLLGGAIGLICKNNVEAAVATDISMFLFVLIQYWYYVLRFRDFDEEPFYKGAMFCAKGVIFFAIAFFVLWFMSQYAGRFVMSYLHDPLFRSYSDIASEDITLYLVLSITIAPLCEELMFRGTGYAMMRKRMKPIVAAVISSVLFAGIHMTFTHLVSAFFVGMMLAWLYEMTGSIKQCIFVHMLYNLTTVTVVSVIPEYYMNPIIFGAVLVFLFCLVFGGFFYINDLRPIFLRDEDPYAKYR